MSDHPPSAHSRGPQSIKGGHLTTERTRTRRLLLALITGAAIGVLGGLIGLGGAEFRLPLLISVFGFFALEAVIVNKAISLIIVASALAFRSTTIPIGTVLDHGSIVINLLAGSLVGAWIGADLATRLATATLYRVIAVLLVLIALVLAFAHDPSSPAEPIAHDAALVTLGLVAGFAIGVIAALLGVAGAELLIPTLVLLFGADIKLAGSLSLAISLPTMLVGFARYSRDRSFAVLGANRAFVLTMAAGSIIGTFIGARLLPIVPDALLIPILALILVVSAIKVWSYTERGSIRRP
jgi:uncharacterized protein